jgi:hypothetical protein
VAGIHFQGELTGCNIGAYTMWSDHMLGADRNVPRPNGIALEGSLIDLLSTKLNEIVVGETFGAGPEIKRRG